MEENENLIINYKVLAVDGRSYLLYKKGNLYFSNNEGKNVAFIGKIPMESKKRLLANFRITTRLLRLEPRTASILGDNKFLISYSGKIYYVDVNKSFIKEELILREGMNNPLTFTRVSSVDGFIPGIYFGEYFSNNGHEAVRIFRRHMGLWEVAFSFPPDTIYHIHGIVSDANRKCLYILTGDADQESAIWEAKDNFASVKPILKGKQVFRSCVAFPYHEGIVYATDTSREQNYLCYAMEKNGNWISEKISRIPGPCIYGTEVNGEYYFATSVEPDDTLSDFRFRYTYKLGKGVKDRWTHIIRFYGDGETEEILKIRKDILPMLLFQFGNCLFPDNRKTNKLVFSPISVKKYDGKTIIKGK